MPRGASVHQTQLLIVTVETVTTARRANRMSLGSEERGEGASPDATMKLSPQLAEPIKSR